MKQFILYILLLFSTQLSAQLSCIRHHPLFVGSEYSGSLDPDNNLYMVGYAYFSGTNSYGKGLLVTKYDPEGAVLWTRKYDFGVSLNDFEAAFKSGQLFISGVGAFPGFSKASGFITAIDTGSGKIMGTRAFQFDGLNMNTVTHVKTDKDNNVYLSCRGSYPSSDQSAYIVSFYPDFKLRFVRKNVHISESNNCLEIMDDRIVILNGDRVGIYTLDGKFLNGYQRDIGGSYYTKWHFYKDPISDLAVTSSYWYGSGWVGFRVEKIDKTGKIIQSSPIYEGYIDEIKSDREGNIHVFTDNPYSTHPPEGSNYYRFDNNLNLQTYFNVYTDSVPAAQEMFPNCAEKLRLFAVRYPLYKANELQWFIPQSGPGVRINSISPVTHEKADLISPNVMEDGTPVITEGTFAIKEGVSVDFPSDTSYSYPACSTFDFFPSDTSVCAGQLELQLPQLSPTTVCNEPILELSWNDGSHSTSRTIDTDGMYTVHIEHAGCNYFDTIQVRFDTTQWPFHERYELCLDDSARLFDPGIGYSGSWTKTASSLLRVDNSGEFQFTGSNVFGCTVSRSLTIDNRCDNMVYLPSAFTPDGDGTNDVFRPLGAGLTVWKLSVFDRFGTSIYEGDQFAGGWIGNNQNKQPVDGLFVLKLDYLEPDSGKEKTVFGKIFVQR